MASRALSNLWDAFCNSATISAALVGQVRAYRILAVSAGFSPVVLFEESCAAGVMGGVTSMDGFLDKFFPTIKAREAEVPTVHNLYCQYNSQTLQLMTSSLFIAGAVCELSGTTGAFRVKP